MSPTSGNGMVSPKALVLEYDVGWLACLEYAPGCSKIHDVIYGWVKKEILRGTAFRFFQIPGDQS